MTDNTDSVADSPPVNLRQELRKAFTNWNFEQLAVLTSQLTESLAKDDNCCMNDQWRGHACQYHQGVEDGMDIVLDILQFTEQPDENKQYKTLEQSDGLT